MVAEKQKEKPPAQRRNAGTLRPGEVGSQGIMRDERGQEQPADKERAQRTSKTDGNGRSSG